MKQKGSYFLFPLLIITLVLGILVYYFFWQKGVSSSSKIRVCTQEAKQCSDGSYVSRTGPNCEFAQCPQIADNNQDVTIERNGLKVYQNEKLGFEFTYPKDWDVIYESREVFSPHLHQVNIGPAKDKGNPGYDGLNSMSVYDKSKTTVDEVISQFGSQFKDKVETRQEVTINGVKAIKVIVTTPTYKDWKSIDYVFETTKFIYAYGNGASKDANFEKIAKTIKIAS